MIKQELFDFPRLLFDFGNLLKYRLGSLSPGKNSEIGEKISEFGG
ncbi:MAG: hypothetical protein ABI840_08740 [bacterium]